jgi:hypothetical protein
MTLPDRWAHTFSKENHVLYSTLRPTLTPFEIRRRRLLKKIFLLSFFLFFNIFI